MSANDHDGTTLRAIRPIYDHNGSTHSVIQTVYDNDGTTNRTVYVNRVYIVQNGAPVTSVASWSLASVEGGKDSANYGIGSYGLSIVQGTGGDQGQTYVKALATNTAISLSGFTRMYFVFTAWARDGGTGGYYFTGAGVYSNRYVGRSGGDSSSNPIYYRPSSTLAGWVCNEMWPGTGVLDISGISSGYIGLSSGGGWYGNGSILVSDIYME